MTLDKVAALTGIILSMVVVDGTQASLKCRQCVDIVYHSSVEAQVILEAAVTSLDAGAKSNFSKNYRPCINSLGPARVNHSNDFMSRTVEKCYRN